MSWRRSPCAGRGAHGSAGCLHALHSCANPGAGAAHTAPACCMRADRRAPRAARQVDVEGGPSPRPLMSVPHPLSGESCCYYHGYVLAEMAVQQTRAHFLATYGGLVDRPEVGRDLAEGYWRPGNTEPFLGLVARLTGAPLAADAWVAHLQHDLDARCAAGVVCRSQAAPCLQCKISCLSLLPSC